MSRIWGCLARMVAMPALRPEGKQSVVASKSFQPRWNWEVDSWWPSRDCQLSSKMRVEMRMLLATRESRPDIIFSCVRAWPSEFQVQYARLSYQLSSHWGAGAGSSLEPSLVETRMVLESTDSALMWLGNPLAVSCTAADCRTTLRASYMTAALATSKSQAVAASTRNLPREVPSFRAATTILPCSSALNTVRMSSTPLRARSTRCLPSC